MLESSDFNENDYKTIENDCKDIKSHFDNYKYAFIEKLKKEQCLTKLKEKSSFDCEHIQKLMEINKERLNNVKKVSKEFDLECQEKSKVLYNKKIEREKNFKLLDLEKKKKEELDEEIEKLLVMEENFMKENEEEEELKMKLQMIEDKISEYEKIEFETDDSTLEYLENMLKGKKEEFNALKNIKNDDRNVNFEELFCGYKKTREFLEKLFGFRICELENIKNGFKILLESENIKIWIFIENNNFLKYKIVKCNIDENEIQKLFLFCKKINDPVLFFKKMVYNDVE